MIIALHTTAGLERPLTKLARASLRTYRAEAAGAGRRVRKAARGHTAVHTNFGTVVWRSHRLRDRRERDVPPAGPGLG